MTMQINVSTTSPTHVKLSVTADKELLDAVKQQAVSRLGRNLKVQGFRPGKAPLHLIEKQLDQQLLQSEFLETAVNQLYVNAAQRERLRPIAQPTVSIKKFVPYDTLEVDYEADVIGKITLPDFAKIKVEKKPQAVSTKDVDEVIAGLRSRAASKEDVDRAAKDGDSVVIDFTGVDAKTKEPIQGADGKAYPLTLGSKTFIPGFEEELNGLKAGDIKEFTVTFPADYGSKELQKRKVTFSVTVQKVQKVIEPKLDDAFAATVGPFESLSQLKGDIKKQIQLERDQQSERAYENDLLEAIAAKSKVELPTELVDEEIERIEADDKKNIVYRGQTWQEHLAAEGVTEEEHRKKQRPAAELRVKAGLILGEIVEAYSLQVTPQELDAQIAQLKAQYNDPAMQAEMDKSQNRRDILNRMLSQKALDHAKTLVA